MSKRKIVHVEIPAKDRADAAKFYGDVFGWTFQVHDEMNYTTFATDNIGGGFNPLGEQVKVGDVLVYFESSDIDDDMKAIEGKGGKVIMPKTEIPDIGWFGIFQDPTGNTLALYTDKTA